MALLEDCPAISERLRKSIPTSGIDASALGTTLKEELLRPRDGWQEAIDQLAIWSRNPAQLEDDGLRSPSFEIIKLALQVAVRARAAGWPAPLRVVPNGEGGIVFERAGGELFETLEVRADGSIEQVTYEHSRLSTRRDIFLIVTSGATYAPPRWI